MALGQLPPWLNVSPETFLDAAKAGSAMGVQLANAQQRATESAVEAQQRAAANAQRASEAAAANALRQWEFEQNMALKAADLAAERERYAAALDETRRYHTGTLEEAASGQAIRAAHNQALEDIARERLAKPGNPIIRSDGRGGFVQIMPDGSWTQIKEPTEKAAPAISPSAALGALTGQTGLAGMLDQLVGPGATTNLAAIARSGMLTPSAAAGAPAAKPDTATLRKQAAQAIVGGKDPDAVRKLFKELTGEDL